jgi:calcineurin-like phosphoesterase family protein
MEKRIFFTSDPHWGHANVIKYANRPFHNVDEMNTTLIKNLNQTVGVADELYILGDFIFGTVDKAVGILSQIKCQNKHFIFGNHDETMRDHRIKSFFKTMSEYKEIYVPDATASKGKQMICLMHYPMIEWNKGHRGSWMLHGHTHGNLKYPGDLKNNRITDVGVDCWNYKPVSYEELKELFKNRVDIKHHGD